MKPLAWILAVVLLVACVLGVVLRDRLTSLWRTDGATASPAIPPPSPLAADDAVWALGRLAPEAGIVDLAGLPGDRLLELAVQAGQEVTPETVLGKLESEQLRETEHQLLLAQIQEARDRIAAERQLAEARLETARLLEQQAAETARLEEEVQVKRTAALAAIAAQAERELARVTVLVRESPTLVSQQEVERQQLAWQSAVADHEAAEATLTATRAAAQQRRDLAESEREVAELALANVGQGVPLASLELQEQAAAERLRRAAFRSPIAGRILRVFAKPGELLGQRPVLQVADVSRMVCVAEVAHDQIAHIRIGQSVVLHSRAFGDTDETRQLKGEVVEIGSLAASPELRQLDPFASSDRHSLEVRVALGPAESAVAARFVHLQLDVQFLRDSVPTTAAAP